MSIVAIDTNKAPAEKISPFDNLIQIIKGSSEIAIAGNPNILHAGSVIGIRAHSSTCIKENERFKMISTIIKRGYEGNTFERTASKPSQNKNLKCYYRNTAPKINKTNFII